jgi:hypothetical protein
MKKTYNIIKIILFTFLGLMQIANAQSWGDYSLIAPQNSTTAKLLTLSNTVYKTWTLTGTTGYSCFLTPDRCLIRIVGGGGGTAGSKIEKVNWDGQVVWSYTIAAHHDICYMPNGHVLVTVNTTATSAELAQYGFTGITSSLKYDKIVEVDGVNGQIVWEWRFIDHTVQNTNSSLSNFGDPSSTPNKFNIAVPGSQGYSDWQHLNGIDYNPERDQIVLSCKHLKEIFVIDHSTTTAEAKTGSGGLSGKGGDFLYRWGNPSNYGKTGSTFGVLHDAAWGLNEIYQAQRLDPSGDNYHAYANMISVWSNTNKAGMCIIPPYIDSSYLFSYTEGSAYLPENYYKKVAITGNSTNEGGNHMLPNGNMMLFAGVGASTVYEKDSTGATIWSYTQASNCSKVKRYSTAYVNGDYATIIANIQVGTIDTTQNNSHEGIANINPTEISFKNPVHPAEIMQINNIDETKPFLIQLIDLNGRLIITYNNHSKIEIPDCEPGMYILKINNIGYKILIQNN